jgi:hypothetical protein
MKTFRAIILIAGILVAGIAFNTVAKTNPVNEKRADAANETHFNKDKKHQHKVKEHKMEVKPDAKHKVADAKHSDKA